LSTKRNERRFRTPRRGKSSRKLNRKHAVAGRLHSARAEEEILSLVRTGVERFILKNATVEDFFKTIQAVAAKERAYTHQLTRPVFSRIVREAIRKRNLRR
jgi:DNA-binding NarL/FixJ family response regulator